MKRRLFTILSVLSLLLCVAVGVLWVRSYWTMDILGHTTPLPFGIDEHYMLKALPGTFAAGEMLDWEAPTGGYLLTACFATGKAAARGVLTWLER